MAGSRTLKLSILADVADLTKNLQSGSKETESFGSKVADTAKKAALAFAAVAAAAGAMALKIGKEGVQAAIEDQKSFAKLEETLKSVTGATKLQIAAVEEYIAKTELRVGIEDTKLRSSFDRLIRSTGDAAKSQQLLNLALDISAATGKDVNTVVQALGKGADGTTTSIGRLGIGIDATSLKTKSFDEITADLQERFGGFADKEANTLEGQFRRIDIAMDNAKETIGYALLPTVATFADFLSNKAIPRITELADKTAKSLEPAMSSLTEYIKMEVLPFWGNLFKFIKDDLFPAIKTLLQPAIDALRGAFSKITDGIRDNKDTFEALFNTLKTVWGFIKEYMIPIIGTALGFAITALGNTIAAALKVILPIIEIVSKAISGIINFIDAAIQKIIGFANAAISALNVVIGAVNKVPGINISPVGKISTSPTATGSVANTTTSQLPFGGATLPSNAGAASTASTGTTVVTTPTATGSTTGLTGNTTINVNAPSLIDEEGLLRTLEAAIATAIRRGTTGGGGLYNAQIL